MTNPRDAQTAPELMPCPLCGNMPEIRPSESGKLLNFLCPENSTCHGSGLIICFAADKMQDAVSAWNRRADTPARAGMVKPLVWEIDTESACTRAFAPIYGGKMIVVELDPGSGEYSAGIDLSGLCFRLIQDIYGDEWGHEYSAPKKFETIEAAKAAAQEDHEARTLAALQPGEAQGADAVAWKSVERKFYRSEWPISKLLEARNGGLVTDDGEAWVYVYSHKDGTGGEYDLLRRREPATPPAAQVTVAEAVSVLLSDENQQCVANATNRVGMTQTGFRAALRALVGQDGKEP